MILLLGGTTEGRQAAGCLTEAGFAVLLSVVSDYGAEIGAPFAAEVRVGPLDATTMARLVEERDLAAVVDAAHPFAVAAHENAREAARLAGKPYLRLERTGGEQPEETFIHRVDDFATAAAKAATLGEGTIFLTTGSRTLAVFLEAARAGGRRVVVRVLPDAAVLSQCVSLGLSPRDIVAMEGPFGHDLNVALFRHCRAGVVVSKDSGETGGLPAKLSAARELGLPVVLVSRPPTEDNSAVKTPEELPVVLDRLGIKPEQGRKRK